MVDIKRITGPQPPGGHYSSAVAYRGVIYIAGQLPVPGAADEPFRAQAHRAINNLIAVLNAAGVAPESLLQVSVYLVDIANWAEFNDIYAERMGTARPARIVIPVPKLHHGYLIEIAATAAEAQTSPNGAP